MLLACLIWVATMAATACAVARTSSSQPVTSPIRARANRHCPPTGTERASSTPGELAVSVPILASSASSTAPAGAWPARRAARPADPHARGWKASAARKPNVLTSRPARGQRAERGVVPQDLSHGEVEHRGPAP